MATRWWRISLVGLSVLVVSVSAGCGALAMPRYGGDTTTGLAQPIQPSAAPPAVEDPNSVTVPAASAPVSVPAPTADAATASGAGQYGSRPVAVKRDTIVD